MTGFDFILTHPGSSHKDEFLACSLLLALHPVPILRREPTPDDLRTPSVCVVDAGHQHEPELNNFDHHQFPADHKPTCSLSLVLQHMKLYEDALEFCDWLETAEWFDCRGPAATATHLGVPREIFSTLISPIDITLLRRFALAERLEPTDPLAVVMRMIGEDILDYVRGLRARMDFIGQHASVWDVDLSGENARVLFLPRTEPLPEQPSMGIERYVEKNGLHTEIAGLVYPDRRGTGYGLSRFRDHPRFDFTRIADCDGVHFAHARGFVAKTSETRPDRLKELLVRAAG